MGWSEYNEYGSVIRMVIAAVPVCQLAWREAIFPAIFGCGLSSAEVCDVRSLRRSLPPLRR
jgi:hypothetical protein